MPPKSKNKQQIEEEKQKIIDNAMIIIREKGLSGLTMRSLAKSLGMTATSIYYYFINKNEIYLYILIRGFDLLYEKLESGITQDTKPLNRLELFLRAYINFGMTHQSYYELMFSTNDPKSLEFAGLPVESLAMYEKENAMKVYNLLNDILKSLEYTDNEDDIWVTTMRVIAEIHGVVNVCHTNIVHETFNKPEDVFENVIDHILSQFRIKQDTVKSGHILNKN